LFYLEHEFFIVAPHLFQPVCWSYEEERYFSIDKTEYFYNHSDGASYTSSEIQTLDYIIHIYQY
jgi:hypothetical protein